MKNPKKFFPALKSGVYANTAAYGVLHERLFDWRQEHDLDYLIGGGVMKTETTHKLIGTVRKTVANFFSCKAKNVALVPNFSIGLNLLLEGLNTEHKVLLLEGDYPSVNWPFEQRGFTTSYVAINENLEKRIYEKIKSEDINILALSLVQWLNGIKIDLDFLKKLKLDFPNLLIIADGTQFCGTTDFNFEDSGIDVLGASAYKWLLSGNGNGFMLCKDVVADVFNLKAIGFNSVNGDLNGRDAMYFTKHLEPGHLDTLAFGSLKRSLELMQEKGMPKIEGQLIKLSQIAKEKFNELHLLEDAVIHRKQHSTIFNIKANEDMFHKLTENDIVCSQRGTGVRLSFHFYNTADDIDTITEILKNKS